MDLKKNMYLSQSNNQRYRQPTHRLGLVESFSGHYLYRKNQSCRRHCLQVGHVQKVELYFTFLFLISWPGLLLLLPRFLFVCLFSFSFARHLLGFVTVVKV